MSEPKGPSHYLTCANLVKNRIRETKSHSFFLFFRACLQIVSRPSTIETSLSKTSVVVPAILMTAPGELGAVSTNEEVIVGQRCEHEQEQ